MGGAGWTYSPILSEIRADYWGDTEALEEGAICSIRAWRTLGLAASTAAVVAALLHACFTWSPSIAISSGPATVREELLAQAYEAQQGQGGCKWSENCAKTGCCTLQGFKCVQANQWWSVCVKSDTPDPAEHASEPVVKHASAPEVEYAKEPVVEHAHLPARVSASKSSKQDGDHEAKCSGVGEDCTNSKCCASEGQRCQKNTDGIWWKSTCKEVSSGSDGGSEDSDTGVGEEPNTQVGQVLHAERCGRHMPDDVHKRWEVATTCAKSLVQGMTKDEKLAILHGSPGGMGFAGYVKVEGVQGAQGTVRLTMNDGPQGYNGYTDPTIGKGTQYPDLIAVAASFDRGIASKFGAALAEEFRTKGCSVLLGPDVEVVRTQYSGRSFESLSGEDPYLGSQLGAAYVREVQSRGVIATVKHWLNNNQETNRQMLDVAVGDRAQHEVYMAPFKGAIDAGAGAVMCSYNKVYGEYACENSKLMRLLREDLGFQGFVISDWGAVRSGLKSAEAGLNVEMPEPRYFKHLAGSIPHKTLDDRAGQVLAAIYASGQFHGKGPKIDFSWPPPYYNDAASENHRSVARQTVIESTVLLKNSGSTLPLVAAGLRVVMVGKACRDTRDQAYGQGSTFSAGGSGYVATRKEVTPLHGLKNRLGNSASVAYSEDGSDAGGSDVAVVCAAAHAEEGQDRKDLKLPQAQELISTVKAQSSVKRIILVAIVPGAVTTEWIDDVDASLVMFMPGEQVGPALAEMLVGNASPSGRLPVTFPTPDERRFTESQYPGVGMRSDFSEGVLVGYRWNEAMAVPAAFPFGFGLSYSTFDFSDFKAVCDGEGASVSLTVTNTGARPDTTVPQLYIGFPSLRPVVRQLRGFQKVRLTPSSSATVRFDLGIDDWSSYDEGTQQWRSATEDGEEVMVSVGTSAVDLLWTDALRCGGTALV